MVATIRDLPRARFINRRFALIFCAFLGLGLAFSVLNIHLPVARNALDYAKAALELVKRHYNVSGVVNDQVWAGGKPILFSFLAAPFVSLTNANVGTVIASTVGTTFFFGMVILALTRLNRRAHICIEALPLQFALTVFNPLVLYQFWSGYPDSLFAGLVLLSFYLTDVIATEPERDSRPHIIGLCVTICAAMYTKFYGAVLSIMCLAHLLLHKREIVARSTCLHSKLALLAATFVVAGVIVITARLGVNPLLIFGSNSGFGDYLDGLWGAYFQDGAQAFAMLLFSVILAFHVTLPFGFTADGARMWRGAQALFIGIYVLGLLPATGASYNMRYFLAVLPFIASPIAAGLNAISKTPRRIVLITYAGVASILVANFNVQPVEEAFRPLVTKIYQWQPRAALWLDNLRLPVQISLQEQIDTVNAQVPQGSVLYWSSDYSGPATHGLARDLGVRSDLDVRYVLESSDVPASTKPVYLTEFTSAKPPERLWRIPEWATPRNLGHGLFKLDPVSVKLISEDNDYVEQGRAIRIEAKVGAGDGLTPRAPRFVENGEDLVSESNQPLELQLNHPTIGRHEFRALLQYGEGGTAASDPLVIYVGVPAFERAARTTSDVVMEIRGGSIWATQDMLWLDESERVVGIRFENIDVARGTHLAHAYLRLTPAAIASSRAALEIRAQLSGDVAGLRFADGDLSNRLRTTAHVTWSLGSWKVAGQSVVSPDLASLMDEVLSQTNWRSGNAIMLLIRISGHDRLVDAADDNGHGAPVLYCELQPK